MMSEIKLAIVVSEFNHEVTSSLLEGALSEAQEQGIARGNIKILTVPGVVEIPLVAQCLAKQKTYHAIICLGAVIRGETGHYDFVCQQVSDGCQKVMLEHSIPVIFGILTTENSQQAMARAGGDKGNKGQEAVTSGLQMIKLLEEFSNA